MRRAVADITFAAAEGFDPAVVVEPAVEFHIHAANANALAGHAREVRLTAGDDRDAAVQDVIPDVPLGLAGRVHRGDEIHRALRLPVGSGHLVSDLNNELVRADAIERGDVEVWQPVRSVHAFASSHTASESGGAVCRTRDRTLPFGPAQRVHAQRRPVLLRVTARGELLAKFEQIEMPRLMRTKAADLYVVAQQIRVAAHVVRFAGEKLLLKIETRPPRQAAAHLHILAHDVPQHVAGHHPLCGIFIVQTARRVNVVISTPVA